MFDRLRKWWAGKADDADVREVIKRTNRYIGTEARPCPMGAVCPFRDETCDARTPIQTSGNLSWSTIGDATPKTGHVVLPSRTHDADLTGHTLAGDHGFAELKIPPEPPPIVVSTRSGRIIPPPGGTGVVRPKPSIPEPAVDGGRKSATEPPPRPLPGFVPTWQVWVFYLGLVGLLVLKHWLDKK